MTKCAAHFATLSRTPAPFTASTHVVLMFQNWMTLIAPHLLPSSGPAVNDSLRSLAANRVDAALFRTRSKSRKEKEEKTDTECSEVKQ